MEELKQTIIEAVVEGQKQAFELGYCGARTGNQLINGKDPYELLTIEQVHEETGIGLGTVQDIFADPELNAQRYTTPFKATRKAVYEYLSVQHDHLSKRERRKNR